MHLGKVTAAMAGLALTISAQTDDLVAAFNMVNQARIERFVPPLSWNADLAAYSQLWANLLASNQVPFQHAAGAYRPSQGEVLYVQEASGCHPSYDAPFQSAMHAWLAQAPLYDNKPITTGHEPWLHWCKFMLERAEGTKSMLTEKNAAQCMWSQSMEIGCARAYSISDAYKVYVVCRFTPEGNV
ncbi:SCP-like extracellular [Cordyceps militaris CM01]|uniref:SCP-like extracellular n=1 Tax=Cordyceps militaris (strain CM01) TaxID=983644 RepID=G3JLT9_CORMM|nr:SCP-like extracellular [Cordyceps militaris CM01]EGX90663.1 SCP-like extracellular [Cordyceps militaris CM01]